MSLDPQNALTSRPPAPLPTRTEYAYRQIREWIINGDLPPGQKLDQDWLAQVLGVSRTPLRQAIQRLESEHLVDIRPYVGAAVAPLAEVDLLDIYATRAAIESMLAYESANQPSAAAVSLATDALAAQEVATSDAEFVDADRRFHRAMYEVAGYSSALEILGQLLDRSHRYALAYANERQSRARSIDEHRAILEAFRDRRAEDAGSLTASHIERGKLALLQLVGSQSEEHSGDDE